MKKLIKKIIIDKLQNDDTPAISFEIPEFGDQLQWGGHRGSIQFDKSVPQSMRWAVFFNGKCVKCSSLLQTCVNKLKKLGVNQTHFELEESII
tara:strand:- start:1191 stop:1469 length:279 start_codon:yes stop_codon:yes gene_type:complete